MLVLGRFRRRQQRRLGTGWLALAPVILSSFPRLEPRRRRQSAPYQPLFEQAPRYPAPRQMVVDDFLVSTSLMSTLFDYPEQKCPRHPLFFAHVGIEIPDHPSAVLFGIAIP